MNEKFVKNPKYEEVAHYPCVAFVGIYPLFDTTKPRLSDSAYLKQQKELEKEIEEKKNACKFFIP